MPRSFLFRRCGYALGACAMLACSDMRGEPRTHLKTAPPPVATISPSQVIATTPMRDECFGADSTETSAMKCSAGAVSRFGDTLQIRLSGAGVRKRVDHPQDGENSLGFRYAGRIGGSSGGPGFHVVDGYGQEKHWVELINVLTGDSLVIAVRPIISPDGARFVMGDMSGLGTCASPAVIQVWRITGDAPVREFHIESSGCSHNQGWGPSNAQWLSGDSISFLRNTSPRDSTRRRNMDWDTTRVTLVHRAGGWMIEGRP